MTQTWPGTAIFTVGHSTLPLADFIALLQTYGIAALADVRTVPRSRHNSQFNDGTLREALRLHGIEYAGMRSLGGLRHPRKDSPNGGWRNDGFRGYADYMQTPDFARGLEELMALGQARRTAIMCAEAVPWRCHRSLIADALVVHGIVAEEIVSANRLQLHTLTPFANVDGKVITYPPLVASPD